jgi:hypothetical protein
MLNLFFQIRDPSQEDAMKIVHIKGAKFKWRTFMVQTPVGASE